MKSKALAFLTALFLISGIAFAGGKKDKETTASILQQNAIDRYHNIYDQPYDPDAVIDSYKSGLKIGPMTIVINSRDGWLYVRDPYNKQLGSYSLKYQCWNSYSSVLNAVDLKLSQFYRSIDLSKTDLNRDKSGNFCGYTGAALPYEYTEEAIAKANKPKTGNYSSTGSSSSTVTSSSSSLNSCV